MKKQRKKMKLSKSVISTLENSKMIQIKGGERITHALGCTNYCETGQIYCECPY